LVVGNVEGSATTLRAKHAIVTAAGRTGTARWQRATALIGRWSARCALALSAVLLGGCGAGGCGEQLPPDVSVTGANKGDPTSLGTQSETAVNVSVVAGKQIITVTYNDDTDANKKIAYTAATRTVMPGATMLGWSYSTDSGKTWTYGGTVAPPANWAALWGDPAITSDFSDQRYVFISSLAIPSSKMPAGGISGPVNDYIGGACIAISSDGGKSFKIDQCLSDNSDFYDGGSMVAAGSPTDRRVFASFIDWDTAKIDVWSSPTDTGTFTQMANPFPGMKMASHPRLRFDRDTDTLYAGAINDGDGRVYLNRYTSSWGKPVVASLPTAGNPTITLSDRTLRTAYQFSYDVGTPSANGNDAVRMLYTVRDPDSSKLYVRGSYCTLDLTVCKDAPEWGTTPGNFNLKGQQFNPKVRAFTGFFGIAPEWKAAYESTDDDPNGNKVSFKEGNLVVLPNGARLFLPFDLVKSQLVCPDNRGYWGDYDELQFAGFDKDSTVPRFILPHSDSTTGCPTRWEYTSNHLHVSAAVFK
jgi:hypothetical protein